MNHIKSVALYARISTQEGKQHLQNQLRALREYSRRMKWTIVAEFREQASGASDNRPELERLMLRASKKDFDAVLVTHLSRLTRKGPASAFQCIERLNAAGVQFWSLHEEHFRTAGPAGALMIAIAAYIAEQERITLRERINAGIRRAQAKGIHCGRPRIAISKAEVKRLRSQGLSIRQIAQKLKIGKTAVVLRLK